jgi:NAD(P)-dependent dehydrogenase (short-subunit alcohol dehydrogenase family)
MITHRTTPFDAVIVGGTSGIGLALVRHLLGLSRKILIVGRHREKIEDLLRDHAGGIQFHQADLGESEQLAPTIEAVKQAFPGGLNAFVYAPAVYRRLPFHLQDSHDLTRLFQVNTLSAMILLQGVFPLLKKKARQASALLISSSLSKTPVAETTAYAASKAALDTLVRALALEWAPHGIRINSLLPGIVATPLHRDHGESDLAFQKKMEELGPLHPLGRVGSPEEVAALAALLLSTEANWITGVNWLMDGGISLV